MLFLFTGGIQGSRDGGRHQRKVCRVSSSVKSDRKLVDTVSQTEPPWGVSCLLFSELVTKDWVFDTQDDERVKHGPSFTDGWMCPVFRLTQFPLMTNTLVSTEVKSHIFSQPEIQAAIDGTDSWVQAQTLYFSTSANSKVMWNIMILNKVRFLYSNLIQCNLME